MQYSDYRFKLDIQSGQSQVFLPVAQYDTSRRLFITLTESGNPYGIEDGCIAVFFAKKADGHTLSHYCVIENQSTIRYDFTKQTASCAGIVNCEIRLYGEDGKLLTSPSFSIVVEKRVVQGKGYVPSESEDDIGGNSNIISAEDSNSVYQKGANVPTVENAAAFGKDTSVLADNSFAEGEGTIAGITGVSGVAAHAEGYFTKALGDRSHTEGYETQALTNSTHAEGAESVAGGKVTYNEDGTRHYEANPDAHHSHAEGRGCSANGRGAHAEGWHTEASGDYSHTEGSETKTTEEAANAHAGGNGSVATHKRSFVHGLGLQSSREDQAVFGRYNTDNPDAFLIIGNGKNKNSPSNAFEFNKDGSIGGIAADKLVSVMNTVFVGLIGGMNLLQMEIVSTVTSDNQDLNSAFYKNKIVLLGVGADNFYNCPASRGSNTIVITVSPRGLTGAAFQIVIRPAFDSILSDIAIRGFNGANWTSWRKIATTVM